MLAGGRTSQFTEGVTTVVEVTGTFTVTGEKTGKIDLHKSIELLMKTFSPAATFPDGSCGEDKG